MFHEKVFAMMKGRDRISAGLFPEDMEPKVWDEIRDKLQEIFRHALIYCNFVQ